MRIVTIAILPVRAPAGAALSSSSVGKIMTSPSSPAAGVGGDSPSAATVSGCTLGEMSCALSVPRTQAVIGKLSMCTLSNPRSFRRAAAHSAAACSLAEPAGRGPKRVVSSLTQV